MPTFDTAAVDIEVNEDLHVSGLLAQPPHSRMGVVLAHGAGAGMDHPSMSILAESLYQRGVATFRYQFPYMQSGGKRTDPPALCHSTIRAAVQCAADLMPEVALFAGGRSFGGRMTSQAQGLSPLGAIRGLVFFGFPLHPAKQPSVSRASHLEKVKIPMLFLQGTRDDLADLALLRPIIAKLQPLASLEVLDHADHSFAVLVRSGRTAAEVRDQMLDAFMAWAERIIG
jgi:predicted alpha/beta-hydrolase family hydrolase